MRKRGKIVIVDDDQITLSLYDGMLSSSFELHSFSTAINLEDHCIDIAPDLILLDMNMPDRSGIDACRALSEHPRLHNIPIVMATSDTSTESQNAAWAAGCADFINKPIVASTLQHRLTHHVKMKLLTEQLQNQVYTDCLTEVYNRHYLNLKIRDEFNNNRETDNAISILLVDIDDFKKYNDKYGHIAGDECLRSVAKVLKESLFRLDDFVVRYGGEEFVLIMPKTNMRGAKIIADRIHASLKALNLKHESTEQKRVTLSIGGVTSNTFPKDPLALFKHADAYLFEAKSQGKNQSKFAMWNNNYASEFESNVVRIK